MQIRRLHLLACLTLLLLTTATAAAQAFAPPQTPRQTYDFNLDWRFVKQDVPGAEAAAFDDKAWDAVTTPHTYNDVDTFDEIITRSGERSLYMGPAWYRKRFKLPASVTAAGSKVFLEVEGMRNTSRFYLNGKELSFFQNGVTPHGIDLTAALKYGGEENVLAVRVDNGRTWEEQGTNTAYQWGSKDFNPNYGGLTGRVWLHATGKVYQTLPLFDGLKTTGAYVYAKNIAVAARTADVHVETQVKNESGEPRSVDLSAVVVDAGGAVRATFKGETYDMVDGETSTLKASGPLAAVNLWSPARPALYDVYSVLSIDGKPVDVTRVTTGFRKTDYRGGAGTGGVYINDQFVYLRGFAQRSSNEWAGLGNAYPQWMHDHTAKLLRDSNSNYIRWMHVAPRPMDVEAFDRFGIVQIAPAGDKEKDATGRQWEQRVEVMRSTIVRHRNSPSILFWEAGNSGVSAEHMREMQELARQYDPDGGRVMGCRSLQENEAVAAAGFLGIMVGSDKSKDQRKTPTDVFRAYSDERRDKLPVIEVEDFRDEAARRFWDDFSPPHFGFKKKAEDTWNYNMESYSVAAARRYNEYYSNVITNTDPTKSRWSGYASIIFSDTNSHGRQYASEVCRNSGKVDAVRLPKPSYFTHRVVQNDQPDVHVLGHWTYPAGTKKTVYVISNCDAVELLLDGKPLGKNDKPEDRYVFAFPDVAWQPGTLTAVATREGKRVEHVLRTAGPAKSIRLTPIVGPGGLRADGSDVALFDFEVVDANGERCPTDEARVDFAVTGPAVWRGGYNSGRPGSTNNLHLFTECGINRVAVRATRDAGKITVTARRDGLEQATATVEAKPVEVADGLAPVPHPAAMTPATPTAAAR